MAGVGDGRMVRQRTAQPGDVCVLLEPAEGEIDELRQRQVALQARFGGRPHERVHLTCQRFELPDEGLLLGLIEHLRRALVAVRSFPIVAVSLVQSYHRFWGSRLLRWRIQASGELRRLGIIVEDTLVDVGIRPHFAVASGWVPTVVTALEAIPEVDLDRQPQGVSFPHHLFVVRRVVLSRIRTRGEFEILDTIRLDSVMASEGKRVP
jgi:hypothetical protein